jgi:hypothetical protein
MVVYLVIELSSQYDHVPSRFSFVRVTHLLNLDVLSEPFPWAEALSLHDSTTALNPFLTGSWRYIHHVKHVQRRLP